jgi:chitosanase
VKLHLLLLAVLAVSSPSGLDTPRKKEFVMKLVSSAENSSLNWRAQYRYVEDIHDGRGYPAGSMGFCSGTGDMLEVAKAFTRARPHNGLRRFIPALRRVNAPLRWSLYGDDYSITR